MADKKVATTKPNWDAVPPRDWAEEQAHRVAHEIRRLRGKTRTAQWLADRTDELGYPLSRTVISDIEVGRRRYVTTAEVIVLARALDTAPIALMYPGPYWDNAVQLLPTPKASEARSVDKLHAVQWFSGEQGIYLDILGMPMVDQMNYHSQLLELTRIRKAYTLQERAAELRRRLKLRRNAKRDGDSAVTDDELDELIAEIDDLQVRVDELKKLGNRDLTAESYDQIFGSDGG